MRNKSLIIKLSAILILASFAVLGIGIADFKIGDNVSRLSVTASASVNTETKEETAYVFGILPLKKVAVTEIADIRLCPGGMTFGVKLYTDGVVIVGFSEIETANGKVKPAVDAGLRENDRITAVNGIAVSSSEEIGTVVRAGKPLTLTFERDSKEYTTVLTPYLSKSEGEYKTGMWLKDSTAGIGTVTFVDPETGVFAGLGHGICSSSGELLPLGKGYVTDVTVSGIEKGQSGNPGELKGYFGNEKTGTLIANTDTGVYGVFADSAEITDGITPVGIGLKDSVHEGNATVICSFEDGIRTEYEVKLSHIDKSGSGTKSFVVTVTDERLIDKTGGIVQGMSGSPIIQDGKLIGAVTHVLIGDPTTGYGIFIENMIAGIPDELR